jgi:hypothetical protein
MFSNSQKLTAVIVKWAKPMIDSVVASRLGQLEQVQAANEWVKKYFPVKQDYSIANDLSVLAVPASEILIEPMIGNAIAKLGVQEQDIPSYAAKLVESMIEEADKKGSVSLFNTVELEKSDLEKLRDLLRKNLPVEEYAKYEVIE